MKYMKATFANSHIFLVTLLITVQCLFLKMWVWNPLTELIFILFPFLFKHSIFLYWQKLYQLSCEKSIHSASLRITFFMMLRNSFMMLLFANKLYVFFLWKSKRSETKIHSVMFLIWIWATLNIQNIYLVLIYSDYFFSSLGITNKQTNKKLWLVDWEL